MSSDFQRDDIESYVHSNPESPTRPMSPCVPVSNGIPSTSFVSSFSRIYPEDPPSMSIPEPVLDGVWKKASNLLTNTNAIAKSPGSDEKALILCYQLFWELPSYGNTPEEWAVFM